MTNTMSCRKNSGCPLWQVLCDGKPCVVESAIESDSRPMLRSNTMWHFSKVKLREIIDLAVRIEKMGSQLYKRLAQKTPDPQIKSVLLSLAAEKGRHKEKFRELGRELRPGLIQETYPGEQFEYVGSIVETHMLNGEDHIEQMVENTRSGPCIIKLAISYTKDTILFLNGLRNIFIKEKHAVIDELITEEQAHLVMLLKLLREVTVPRAKNLVKIS